VKRSRITLQRTMLDNSGSAKQKLLSPVASDNSIPGPSQRDASTSTGNVLGNAFNNNTASSGHLPSEPSIKGAGDTLGKQKEKADQYNKMKDEEEGAPTPYVKIYLIGMMLLVNHFSVFVIPTFLPFMIQDFFPDKPFESLGKSSF
jgi:hypothetical protein